MHQGKPELAIKSAAVSEPAAVGGSTVSIIAASRNTPVSSRNGLNTRFNTVQTGDFDTQFHEDFTGDTLVFSNSGNGDDGVSDHVLSLFDSVCSTTPQPSMMTLAP